MDDRKKKLIGRVARWTGGTAAVAGLFVAAPVAGPVILLGGLATAAGGVVMGAARRGSIALNKKYGRGLCLIGPEGSGKTTLKNVLFSTNDTLETVVPLLHGPERVKRMGGGALRLKFTEDLPGRQYAYTAWQRAVEKSDIALYLLDITRMPDEAYQARVFQDADVLGAWFEEGGVGHGKPLVIVATHADRDPRYDPSRPGQYAGAIHRDLDPAMVRMGAGAVSHTFAVLDREDKQAQRASVVRIIDSILARTR